MNKFNYKDLAINISLSLACILFCSLLLIFIIEVRYFIKMKQYSNYAWHDPNTKFDSELGWSPVPNTSINYPGWGMISSNSHGFRSAELDQNKKQIIVLGDSIALGAGVSDTETFPYYLEKMLSNRDYQVSNLAVSGYDIGQYYLFLKRHINKFHDLKQVILLICTKNDLICTGRNECYGKRKPLFSPENNDLILTNNIKKYCLRNLLSKSYFFRTCPSESTIGKFLGRISGDKFLEPNEIKEVSLILIEKIHQLASSHGAELLVILSPTRDDFIEKSPSLSWLEYVFNDMKLKDLYYLDYIEILKKYDQEELNSLYANQDIVHFNRKGNLVLAKTVYESLHKEPN